MKNGSFEILRLDENSASLLQNVAADVFDNEIVAGQLQRFVDDPRHVMFVAVSSEQVIGMCSAVEYFHPDKRPQLWINEIGVTTARRRRGIGRQLIEEMIREAGRRGCVSAWLGTDVGNKVAQACFGSVTPANSPQPFLLYEWEPGS